MRAIGYSRCSTNEQADSGLGLEVQAERIRAYCTLKGLILDDVIVDAGVNNHVVED
jgi:DNA invertase Pin-like site-specific DNA recombinase